MDVKIEQSWKEALAPEFGKPYFASLVRFLHEEKAAGKVIYPPGGLIFNAFALTPVEAVKVVIIGQDPYHGPGQAMGLSFSVPDGIQAPPSLRNIFKEIQDDLGIRMSGRPNLEGWARQGVLLLNTVLTVPPHQANGHARLGWQQVTSAILECALALIPGRHRVNLHACYGNNHPCARKLIGMREQTMQACNAHVINPVDFVSKEFRCESGFFRDRNITGSARGNKDRADAVRGHVPERRVRARGADGGVPASAAGRGGHGGDAREDGSGVRVLRGAVISFLHVALSVHEDTQLVGADVLRRLFGWLLLGARHMRVPRARRAGLRYDALLGPPRQANAERREKCWYGYLTIDK